MFPRVMMSLALALFFTTGVSQAWCSTFSAADIDYVLKNLSPIMQLNKYEIYKMEDPDYFFSSKAAQASSGYLNESDYKDASSIQGRQDLPIGSSDDVPTQFNKLYGQPKTRNGVPLHFWITIANTSLAGKQSTAVPLVTLRESNTLLYVQYWFFYPYNGPGKSFVRLSATGSNAPVWSDVSIYNPQFDRGTHYGDWEHVTLRVKKDSSGSLILSGLFLSRHDFTPWYSESVLKDKFEFRGTHPVVYIASDSHAHYPRPDIFIYHEENITDKSPFISWPTKIASLGQAQIYLDIVDFTTKDGVVYDTSSDKHAIKILASNIAGKPAGDYAWYPYKYRWGQYKFNTANFNFLQGEFIDKEAASGPSGPIDHDPDDIAFSEQDPPFSFGWPGKNENVEVFASSENFEAQPCCMLRHNFLETGDGKWKGWSYSFDGAPPTTKVVTGTTGSVPRNVEVFAITTDLEPAGSGRRIIHDYWDGHTWHGWNNPIAEDPGSVDLVATAQNSNGNLEVFAVPLAAGKQLLHSYYDGSWHPWTQNFQSAPSDINFMASGTSQGGNLEMFAIAGGVLYHNYYDGTWHDWVANFDGAPQMSSITAGHPISPINRHLEVFGVSLDGHMYHDYFDGSWHGWTKDFDGLTGTVVSMSAVEGINLEVFAIDPSGTLKHDFYDNSWHGWTSDFPLGAPKVKAVSGMWHGNVELFAVTEFSDSAFTYLDNNGWHPWIIPFSDSSHFDVSHPSAYMAQFLTYAASKVANVAARK